MFPWEFWILTKTSVTSCCLLFAVLRILLIRFLRGFGSRIVFLRIRIHNNVTFKNQASSLKSFLFFNVIFLASTDIFFLGKIHISLLLNQPPNDPDPHWSAIYQHPNDPDPHWSAIESASKWSGSTLFCYWISLQMIRIHIDLLLNQPMIRNHIVLLWISLQMIRIQIDPL